jgi:hypothetical protein
MIDNRELRIGNAVLLNGDIAIVSGMQTTRIHANCKDYRVGNEKPKYFDPIKLSEGWLLKLGFKYMGEFYDDVDKSYCLDYKWYIIFIDGVYKFGLEYQDFCTELKNIHTLQNLYFALTGEELEIKL